MKVFYNFFITMLLLCSCLSTGIATAAESSGDYKLGSGDKIKVHVFGESDMDVEVRLGASGDIRYPFLGKIHVTGMTLQQLEHKISKQLDDGYLIDPQVRVSMEEFRSFYVNGEVKTPGGYPYQPGLTVRKAISLAGGFSEEADKDKLFLIHNGDSKRIEHKISLYDLIDPGDIITVKQSFFYVNGEVKKPGKFSYQPGITYRMAISMAGDMSERANEDYVMVIHAGDQQQQVRITRLDAEIKAGDMITVKESFF